MRPLPHLGHLLTVVLLCAAPIWAGPAHYLKTHKTVLAADALTALAISADVASSVHCQNIAPVNCVERGFGGPHPTAAHTELTGAAFIAGFVAYNHLEWRFAPNRAGRIFGLALADGAIVTVEAFNARSNVSTDERLAARRRVTRF